MKKIFLFSISILFISCSDKEIKKRQSENDELINGMYIGRNLDKNNKSKFIWIFSNNTIYSLHKAFGNYSDEELGIGYESPSKYYIKNNSIYICGTNLDNTIILLEECRKKNYDPAFKIIKVDTLYDGQTTEQVIQLDRTYSDSKYELRKVFYDTIKRKVNVKLPSLYDLLDNEKK